MDEYVYTRKKISIEIDETLLDQLFHYLCESTQFTEPNQIFPKFQSIYLKCFQRHLQLAIFLFPSLFPIVLCFPYNIPKFPSYFIYYFFYFSPRSLTTKIYEVSSLSYQHLLYFISAWKCPPLGLHRDCIDIPFRSIL